MHTQQAKKVWRLRKWLFSTHAFQRGGERDREREIKICERGPKITIWEEREERERHVERERERERGERKESKRTSQRISAPTAKP